MTGKTNPAEDFGRELRSFFALCILSLVFGALALAFGVQFIVTAVLAMTRAGSFQVFPLLQAFVGWAGVAIGFRWILSSVGILEGVDDIRTEFQALEASPASTEAMAGEALTSLMVRLMAHYRANWKTIWRMHLFSIVGGCIFLALGVLNLLQGISALPVSGGLSGLLPFAAAGINMTMGAVCILLSSWFRRYSRAWERRLAEASLADEALQKTMEQE